MYKYRDRQCLECGKIAEYFAKDSEHIVCKFCNGKTKILPSSPGMVKTNFADKTGFKKR